MLLEDASASVNAIDQCDKVGAIMEIPGSMVEGSISVAVRWATSLTMVGVLKMLAEV